MNQSSGKPQNDGGPGKGGNQNSGMWLWLVAGFLFLSIAMSMQSPPSARYEQRAFSDFLADVETGRVADVTIQGQKIAGEYEDGSLFQSYIPAGADVIDTLRQNEVRVNAVPEPEPSFLSSLLISALPILLLIGVWIFFMRRMQGGGPGGVMGIGRSKAKMLTPEQQQVTFADVAGIDEAKNELEEIVDFLKNPQQFSSLGGRISKGVLLVGPPGTGKTLLAKAIAGEAGVPFFTISGSDFVEMFVGVGASRVRDMFEQAKKNAPCIVFIDEIDAVGRSRGAGLGGGHDEREQTLNQLLVEMDGFNAAEGVILIAATNRPDVLDPALLRPGRFDRQVVVPNPDVLGREQILNVHLRKVKTGLDVDAKIIARGTPGFSGADLANLVNEAALLAARALRRAVMMADVEAAKDKVMMGAERRSMVMTEDEKRLTAYHEAGHALVGLLVPGNDPLHKVAIILRGRALGVTMNLPERDRLAMRKSEIEAKLAMIFGGRIAEELIFGAEEVTTGASNDIQQATQLARRMVTEWGMSDKLGRLRYADSDEQVFLGHSIAQTKNVSDDTAMLIDSEVRRIVEEAKDRARDTLSANMDALHAVSEALLDYETLSGDEVRMILDGKPVTRPTEPSPRPPAARGSVPPSEPETPKRPRGIGPELQPQC